MEVDELYKTILENIQMLITAKRLTIYALTEMSGLAQNTIYHWYNSDKKPQIRALLAVSEALDVPFTTLFDKGGKGLSPKEEMLISLFRKQDEETKNLCLTILGKFKEN